MYFIMELPDYIFSITASDKSADAVDNVSRRKCMKIVVWDALCWWSGQCIKTEMYENGIG